MKNLRTNAISNARYSKSVDIIQKKEAIDVSNQPTNNDTKGKFIQSTSELTESYTKYVRRSIDTSRSRLNEDLSHLKNLSNKRNTFAEVNLEGIQLTRKVQEKIRKKRHIATFNLNGSNSNHIMERRPSMMHSPLIGDVNLKNSIPLALSEYNLRSNLLVKEETAPNFEFIQIEGDRPIIKKRPTMKKSKKKKKKKVPIRAERTEGEFENCFSPKNTDDFVLYETIEEANHATTTSRRRSIYSRTRLASKQSVLKEVQFDDLQDKEDEVFQFDF